MVKDVKEIIAKKKSKNAIFLGSGPSILDLKDNDWQKIKQMDIWTSNNWFIHDIVPDFYHLEVKMHRNGPFAKQMIEFKKDDYKDVNWILDETRPYLFDMVKEGWFKNIFSYKKKYRSNDGRYFPDDNHVQVSCMASITVILDIMSKMDYEKIYFCGVDLYSSEYFWTNNSEYEKYDIPQLIKTCKPDERNPKDRHTTFKTAKFIKEFGDYNDINFVNLSEKSELSKYLKNEKL